jgi:hypothetical protein
MFCGAVLPLVIKNIPIHHSAAFQSNTQPGYKAASDKSYNCPRQFDLVAMYGVFKKALSPNSTNLSLPSSCCIRLFSRRRCNLLASKARQLEEEPPHLIEMSRILPQQSETAWQFKPNLCLRPHRNFFGQHPQTLLR